MWPFNLIAILKKELEISQNRVRDLERTVESSLGANHVLSNELMEAKQREERLLQKVFDITGLNRNTQTIPSNVVNKPIQVGPKVGNWGQVREDLEDKARREHWENKKKENDAKISKLEEEISIGGGKDQVS